MRDGEETFPPHPNELTDDENAEIKADLTDDENFTSIDVKQELKGKIIEVKCGPIYAKMHVEQFLCPGIHQPCIELEGEMISPKEFTVRANKDKQKDWKGSIRIGRSNLRTLMEMRSFDFFNHSQFCSAKCQSRNYITPKEKDPDRDSRRGSTSSVQKTAAAHISQLLNSQFLNQTNNIDLFKDNNTFSQLLQLSTVLNNNNNSNSNNNSHGVPVAMPFQMNVKDEQVNVEDTSTTTESSPVPPPIPAISPPTPEQIIRLMNTDPQAFWSEMNQLGMLDELVDQMIRTLMYMRDSVAVGGVTHVAPVLTRVVSSLNLNYMMVACIRTKQMQNLLWPTLPPNLARPRLSSDYSSLEDTVRKRSIDESSTCSQSQCSPPPEVKRPRVQYPIGMMKTADGLPYPANLMKSEGMDGKVLQALVQAQLELNGSNRSEPLLMPSTTRDLIIQYPNNLGLSTSTVTSHINESMLSIK